MGIRRTLVCAAGAFLVTTVLFAAAMVMAHGLIIPDPVGRVLPLAAADPGESANAERPTEDIALATDRAPQPPSVSDDDVVPEITAVPVPDDAAGTDDVAVADASDSGADDGDRPDRDGVTSRGEPADPARADPARAIAQRDRSATTEGDGDTGGSNRSGTRSPSDDAGDDPPVLVDPPADDHDGRDEDRSPGWDDDRDDDWWWDRDDDRDDDWGWDRDDDRDDDWGWDRDDDRDGDRSSGWDLLGRGDSGWDAFDGRDDDWRDG